MTVKPVNITKVFLLPITSDKNAHKKFPKTIPNKNEDPSKATYDYDRSHSTLSIDIRIDMNKNSKPSQNSSIPIIANVLP